MKPKGKCFCRKCEDCHWLWDWDMEGDDGLRKTIKRCLFQVLGEEIPKIRSSIDGLQGGVNEARNRSMEAKQRVEDLGYAIAVEMKDISTKLIGSK